jgi:hypothetical protein
MDIGHPDIVRHIVDGQTKEDTLFSNVRIHQKIVLDSVCFPPPPLPPIICDVIAHTSYDVSYVWRTFRSVEDKAAVYWCLDDSPALSELPVRAFASATVACGEILGDSQVDIWRWGAATSEPLAIADDWSLIHGFMSPDDGDSPYIVNWQLPDSTPLYMHRLDPNRSTAKTAWNVGVPLWFFDAIPYRATGWTEDCAAYISGIVTTMPSRSRVDVAACGRFTEDYWTLELKRARRTGNGDDIQF